MKNQNKQILFTLIGLFVIIAMPIFASAQDGIPIDPDVPIDGGISLLIAAGVGYGVKELRKKRNNSSKN